MRPSDLVRRVLAAIVLVASVVAPARVGVAGPGDGAPDADAVAAIAAFDAAFDAGTKSERHALVAAMARVRHPKVTERMHRVAEDEKADAASRVGCLDALTERGTSEKGVCGRIGRWVMKESEAAAKAFAKNDFGLPVDRRTGEVRKGRETDEAVKRGQERALVTSAAIRCAVAGGWRPKEPAEAMRPFVQSPFDDVAVAAIGALSTWKDAGALPDLLRLYQMYPRENRWETGAVVHAGGNNASAQAEWMRWFGHPLKQRARPVVVRALQAAFDAVCGRKFESPEVLEAWLRDDGGRRASSGTKR